MAIAIKFLNPVRQSLSSSAAASASYYYSPVFRSTSQLGKSFGRFEPMRTWMKDLEPSIHSRFSKFYRKLNTSSAQCARSLLFSGSTLSVASMINMPFIFRYIGFSPRVAFAMDGQDILVDDRDYSDSKDDFSKVILMLVKKLWLPVFFVITVLMNWDHPLLVTKVLLFLVSTKPSPLSVYSFVERLCHQSMRQKPYLYFLKTLYANKVEVQDYKILCIATVEVRELKLTLVGILGGWWALPLTQGSFSLLQTTALY